MISEAPVCFCVCFLFGWLVGLFCFSTEAADKAALDGLKRFSSVGDFKSPSTFVHLTHLTVSRSVVYLVLCVCTVTCILGDSQDSA